MRTFNLLTLTLIASLLASYASADKSPDKKTKAPVQAADETQVPSLEAVFVNGSDLMHAFRQAADERKAVFNEQNFLTGYQTLLPKLKDKPGKRTHQDRFDTPAGDYIEFPRAAMDGKLPICDDLSSSCLMIDYTDPLAWTWNPAHTSHSSDARPIGNQIFFSDWLTVQARTAMSCNGKNCLEILKAKQLAPETFRSQATSAVGQLESLLKAPNPDTQAIERTVLSNPLSFEQFAAIYAKLDEAKKPLLEKPIEKAVMLTLASFDSAANSHSITYPFLSDDLINEHSFLNWNRLYSQLKEMGRMPKLVSLTPELRKTLGGIYSEQTSEWEIPLTQAVREKLGGEFVERNPTKCESAAQMKGDWKISDLTLEMRTKLGGEYVRKAAVRYWKRVAIYNPASNLIYLDYTGGFYEAVYALQHELWHVFWEHTELARNYRHRVANLLPLKPDCDSDMAIKQLVFFMTIQNELGAINQSNLLYHNTGHLSAQWGGISPSAKAWHDSVFGADAIRKRYLTRTLRKKILDARNELANDDGGYAAAHGWAGYGGPITAGIFVAIHAGDDQKRLALKRFLERASAEPSKLSEMLREEFPYEMQFFEDRYFISIPDLDDLDQPIDIASATLIKPEPIKLTCDQAKRVAALMPSRWKNGIPFLFELKLNPGETCQLSDSVVTEGAGSHPGMTTIPEGAGSHPGISAIPCVNGMEGMGRAKR